MFFFAVCIADANITSIAAVEASDDESVIEAIPHHLAKEEEQADNGESQDEVEEGDEEEEV